MITVKKPLLFALTSLILSATASAQSTSISLNNTNSPYSRFGVGTLNDFGFSSSRGMGGIGVAINNGREINTLNPASYSKVDSLTCLFEGGISMQNTHFSEGGNSSSANNSSFDYLAMQFRIMPKLGITFGLLPFSSVGYNFGSQQDNGSSDTDLSTASQSYYGSGGIHQVFLGLGYEVFPHFSIGTNVSYLFGSIDKYSVSNNGDKEISQTGSINIYDYKIDLGAQYDILLDESKQQKVTLGATYSLGHTMNTSSQSDINTDLSAGLKMPHSFGIGASYTDKKWVVGADYTLQLWKNFNDPLINLTTIGQQQMSNRNRIAAGAEWTPNLYSKKYTQRIKYRFGAYYTTPYYKIATTSGNWQDGPKELGATVGFGLPLPTLGNRSMLNVSLQYSHVKAPQLLSESTFRVCIGLTFNEAWFKKWKVD